MKRTIVAVTLAVIFTLALATPAFGSMEHEATYKLDGTITFSQQAGHWCNTGAEMQQRISGQGSLVKAKDVYMEEGMITVADNNDWVTAPDAIRNLTVTTAIWLCAPPKYEYNDGDAEDTEWNVADFWNDEDRGVFGTNGEGLVADATLPEYRAVSDQVWAVQVAANPGYSGQIDMAFEAANSNKLYESKEDDEAHNAAWLRSAPFDDWPGYQPFSVGPWFPGSYFNIEQFSRTSDGTHRRYIDISSPYSHAYLSETMTVTGMSEVWEAFSMDNLPAGDEVGALWWALF